MAFVNEDISDEDFVKYRIDEMAWGYKSNLHRYWVIDRERDIYLREAADDRGETTDEYWSFYWKGYQWPVYGYRITHEPNTETQHSQYGIRLKFTKFPEVLQPQIEQIRADFMEAYRADLLRRNLDITFVFE